MGPRPLRPALALAPALAVSALLLAGCTGGGADTASAGGGSAAESAAGVSSSASAAPVAAARDAAGDAASALTDRQVITTGDVTVVVDDPRAAVGAVVALVEERGGRVDERSEQGAADGSDDRADATASLTVRVPAAEVTPVLDALAGVGEVASVTLTSSDVTAQARELDARVGALRTSTARLEGLLADAATTADVLAAEQLLSERQGQLESLLAERAALGEQVDLSTLRLQLVGTGAAPVPGPDGFLDGLGVGWDALLRTAGAALLVGGVLAPWALSAAVVVAAVMGLRRRSAARRGSGGPGLSGGPRSAPPARA